MKYLMILSAIISVLTFASCGTEEEETILSDVTIENSEASRRGGAGYGSGGRDQAGAGIRRHKED